MKKYLQITTVLGAFFLLVFLKNLKGNDDEAKVIGNIQNSPTPIEEVKKTEKEMPTSQEISQQNVFQPTPSIAQANSGKYKDGKYDGTVEDAFYGNLQVQAVIKNGKLVDVIPLLYPNDNRTSILINKQALALLRDEAIRAQSSEVDIVSGASDSSPAFSRSLESALKKAQN